MSPSMTAGQLDPAEKSPLEFFIDLLVTFGV